jgi:phospholipid-binding lipoprotein MlaA
MRHWRGWTVVLTVAVLWAVAVGTAHADGELYGAGMASQKWIADASTDDNAESDLYEENNLDEGAEVFSIADPLLPWNRLMFEFNDRLYFWVLKPVARGYTAVVPSPVRVGIDNFFRNLFMPPRFVSCLLQGKGAAAEAELARFFVNTTIGVLGFMAPAKDLAAFNPPEEDLGQTLGVYGIGNGIYIVWPFFGPSTLRDTVGMVGDRFLNPVTYLEPFEAAAGVTAVKTVNDTSFRIGDYETLLESAIIPYEAFRDAYLQYRQKKIAQ